MTEEKELLKMYVEKCFREPQFFSEEFLSHYLTYKTPEFHAEIYRLLKDEKRLAIAAPRGFAKSTLSSVMYPLWLVQSCLWAKDITLISASEGLAIEWLRKIKRELEYNEKMQKFFGDQRTDKWSESHIITKNGVNIRARGAGGQIRGFRPDVLILDDIETDETVDSEEQRNKLKNWIFKACLNTLLPHGQFVIVGTIIHPLSVLSDILNSSNGWQKRKYRAYIDGIAEAGHELWPEHWSHERLQKRKAEIGSHAFSSEFMNDPLSDESAAIKDNQIRYWTEMPTNLSCVIAVDPAYKDDETADYKVAVVVGTDQRMNRYLLAYIRTHAPSGEFIDSIFNLWLQYRHMITSVGVPQSGPEEQFYKAMLEKAAQRKIYPPFAELKNVFVTASGVSKRKKEARIRAALQPLFESGKYFINQAHVEAREELLSIGGASRWDDVVDAMAYAEQLIEPIFMDRDKMKFSGEPEIVSAANYGVE